MAILLINLGFMLLSVGGVLFLITALIVTEYENRESEKEWQRNRRQAAIKRTGGFAGQSYSAQPELPA